MDNLQLISVKDYIGALVTTDVMLFYKKVICSQISFCRAVLSEDSDEVLIFNTATHQLSTELLQMLSEKHTAVLGLAEKLTEEAILLLKNYGNIHLIELNNLDYFRIPEILKQVNECRQCSFSIHFQIHSNVKLNDEQIVKLNAFLKVITSQDITVDKFKIGLVLRELLLNAIIHGNKNNFDKIVKISILYNKSETTLSIVIKDEGEGFDFYKYLKSIKNEDELRVQHRGIFIVEEFCKRVVSKKNKITVEYKLK